jgi:lipid-binding SYLF domain-containing protein
MLKTGRTLALVATAVVCGLGMLHAPTAHADEYGSAIANFKSAGESATFFRTAYAYVVFPDIGEGAFIVGGQGGKGHVYQHGHMVGTAVMGGLSVGFQAGGKVFSEIIFFQDQRALEEFQSGKFEFSAGTSATAITAQVGASASTNGLQANASTTDQNATTAGAYEHGMAVFTVAKGGLMYSANIGGQKFSYTPNHHAHKPKSTDVPAAATTDQTTP